MTNLVNLIFSTGTLLLLATTVALVVTGLISATTRKALLEKVSEYGHLLIFMLALLATFGSLTYSELIGFEPCKLCWFQRLAMFPIVFIGLGTLLTKTKNIFLYIGPLAMVGLLVSIYHVSMQWGFVDSAGCSVVGQSASCAGRWVREYGVITIPAMAGVFFTTIVIVSIIITLTKKRHEIN